jgi:hypothetical protein
MKLHSFFSKREREQLTECLHRIAGWKNKKAISRSVSMYENLAKLDEGEPSEDGSLFVEDFSDGEEMNYELKVMLNKEKIS